MGMHLQKNVQREGTSLSNLTEHIKSQHSDSNERPANQSGISSKASTVKRPGRTMYDWIL